MGVTKDFEIRIQRQVLDKRDCYNVTVNIDDSRIISNTYNSYIEAIEWAISVLKIQGIQKEE